MRGRGPRTRPHSRTIAMRALERRRRLQRPAEVDALRRGEQLDRDDGRRVARHRREPARGEGRHADVVFLVRRGRQRIDAGRMRERLVLGRERRRRDLRDHEARIDAAVARRGTAAGPTASRRSAARCGARRARRSRRSRAPARRPRTRPARRGSCRRRATSPRLGEHQRVVGDARSPRSAASRAALRIVVEAGAHHLRLAAQAVRVLHAVAVEVRGADLAARRAARDRRAATSIWPGWPRSCVDARVERRVAAHARRPPTSRRRRAPRRTRRSAANRPRAPARSRPACR